MVSRNGNAFELELDSRYDTSLLSPTWIGWAFTGWYDADGTYYFSAKDATGNVTTKTLTFHKLTLNGNGGTCGLGYLIGLKGNNISLPAATRTGYTYQGWAETNNATTGSTASQFTANRTLYAVWKVNYYTLNFNVNASGASCSPTSKSVAYGSGYESLPTPMKSYCTFTGWFTAASGGTQVSATTTMGAGDTTVYAHWSYPNYTLYFNANGGYCSEGSRVVTYESAYGTLPTPSRDYHTFAGWFTDPSGGTQVSASTIMGAGNVTVYAHWTPNNYTLSFNANGGSCTTGSKVVTYGSAYGDLPTPTRDYYTFDGWFTAASGGTQVSASTIMSGGDTTVYAHWTVKSYTLTFNTNGSNSSCSESSRKVAYGAAYGTLPTPTRAGWDFVGWFTKASGGTQVTKNTTMGGSNTTVYAHWQSIPGLESTNHTSVTVTLPACSDWKNCQPSITLQVKTSSGWENFASYGLDKNVLSTALTYTFTGLDVNKTYRVATTGNSASGWWRGADSGAYTRCKQTQCAHGAADDCGITCEWK